MKRIFTFSILLVLFFNQNCFAQWQRIKSIDDYAVLCIESYNGTVYAGCDDGGVFISPDNGRNWLKSYKGLPKGSFESIAISDNRIFILSRGNGIYASTDNGETWTSKNSGLPDKYNSFLAINGSYLCTISSEGILISKDYGDTWTKKNNPSNKEITAIAFNENILYMGTNGAGLFLSSDLGDTWLANKELPFKDISAMSFSGNKIFASRSLTNSIYLTTNGGANWNGLY